MENLVFRGSFCNNLAPRCMWKNVQFMFFREQYTVCCCLKTYHDTTVITISNSTFDLLIHVVYISQYTHQNSNRHNNILPLQLTWPVHHNVPNTILRVKG